MASQYKNVVVFADIGVGASALLPHGLNLQTLPVQPDKAFVDNPDFSIGLVDSVNVTVTNNGTSVASCSVLLEHWHTFDRAFGDAANTALSPQPFVPASGPGSWVAVVLGGITYVRPGGDDAAAGTLLAPLATVVEAIRRLATPTDVSQQQIIDCTGVTENITKVVVPAFTSGFPNQLDVAPPDSPLFFVTAPLEIRAVPAVVQGVTITANNPGPTAGQQILTVSDVLVPGAHVGQMVQGAAFNTAGSIYANTANTISVTTLNALPAAGATDIVKPSAELTYGDPAIFSRIAFEISAVYSNASFTGIKFRNNNAGPGDFSVEARTHGNRISFVMCDIENINLFGPDYIFDYCHHTGDWQTNGVGGQFRSSFFDGVSFFMHGDDGFGTNDWSGNVFDGCTAAGHGTTQQQDGGFGVVKCLIDNAVGVGLRYAGGNKAFVNDVVIQNSVGDAVFAENAGTIDLDDVRGAGNGGFGVRVVNGAQVKDENGSTVTGASGDISLGGRSPLTWAQMPAVEISSQCSILDDTGDPIRQLKPFGDTSGVPGAGVINAMTGRAAIAVGVATVVITNSLVSATSRILITPETAPPSKMWSVQPGAGSFTVTIDANAGVAEVFSFEVMD